MELRGLGMCTIVLWRVPFLGAESRVERGSKETYI